MVQPSTWLGFFGEAVTYLSPTLTFSRKLRPLSTKYS